MLVTNISGRAPAESLINNLLYYDLLYKHISEKHTKLPLYMVLGWSKDKVVRPSHAMYVNYYY